MRRMIVSTVIILIFLYFIDLSYCDIIYLKNGREIEGEVIEKNEDKVRIAVSAGTVTFKLSAVEKIEETVFDLSSKSTSEEISSRREKPTDQEIIHKMAEEDIRRSLSGIKVLSVACYETTLEGADKCMAADISYKFRYDQNKETKYIQLFYKYNPLTKRWIRPKKADILKLAESSDPSGDTATNNACKDKQCNRWKKEYKAKGTIRRYRRLIGVDQKKHEEWDN